MNITDFIPFGKDNAIKREQLCSLVGLPDRAVRKLIELARLEGAVIINAQDGRGYYQSDNETDIRRQIASNHSRAMSILRQQRALRDKLAQVTESGQMTMEEVEEAYG